MKAITLHQPWASLIAVGAKTIETRPRGTDYRGPLAIHAGKRPPDPLGACSVNAPIGNYDVGQLDPGAPRRMWRNDVAEPVIDLPLGAVVASATLVDVVPIVARGAYQGEPNGDWTPPAAPHASHVQAFADGDLWLAEYRGHVPAPGIPVGGTPVSLPTYAMTHVRDEEPFGDFSPGRFAWLLADVAPTTERCPWCWGRGYRPDHADVHPEVRDDPNLPCGADACACPVCSGAGQCEPVPARGQQAAPWEWAL